MIERHVTFKLKGDLQQEFSKFFDEKYRPAMALTEGFLDAYLLLDLENPRNVMMALRFENQETAKDWRESKRHAELKPQLKSMYTESTLKVYEVLL